MIKALINFFVLLGFVLIGFAGSFYLVFHGTENHTNFFDSLLTVFLIILGEINFGDHWYKLDGPRYAVGVSLLVAYLVIVSVMLLNLLIELMSAEYESVKADFERRY